MLRWALALLTALTATTSVAQISGTASLVTDYRVRGVSLSDGLPTGQLNLSYDHQSGWYEGAFASQVKFYEHSRRELQVIGYTGYAQRLESGWSVDAGAAYSGFSRNTEYHYTELHIGVSTPAVTARLYFSPNYFGQSIHTVYAELNGSYGLSDEFRLIGHAGLLKAFAGATDQAGGNNPHGDFLGGIEYRMQAFDLQVGRVFSDGASQIYPVGSHQNHGALTARLSITF